MRLAKDDDDRLSALEVEAALVALSDADWKRLFKIAQYESAFDLSGVTGEELIHEAVLLLLDGTRRWKRGVHAFKALPFIAHSISDNWRNRDGLFDRTVAVDHGLSEDTNDGTVTFVQAVDNKTPEVIADGTSQLNQLLRALGDDDEAALLALSWAEDMRGEEARKALGWDEKRHDAVRKRLGRKLDSLRAMRERT
ncbi:MAG: hypothetical protein JNL19_00190 [Burkholderiales bacterium]|nr:hypothetical protein [Burkholderiales bacterium]